MKCYESCFAVALTNDASSLKDARSLSHDTVIANTGTTRRSGVRWSYYPTDEAVTALAELGIVDPDIDQLCRAFPGRILVAATVEVEVDE